MLMIFLTCNAHPDEKGIETARPHSPYTGQNRIAKHIPTKRELKRDVFKIALPNVIRIAKHIPTKRELKPSSWLGDKPLNC